METTLRLESVAQIHEMLGAKPPEHPLITLIKSSRDKPIRTNVSLLNVRIVTELYSISLKQGNDCGIRYGRQPYDFQEGSLMFLAPGQALSPVTESEDLSAEEDGWTLAFHPELIRRGALAGRMAEYRFFSYESHEALHLSERERRTVTGIVDKIREEYSQNIDVYSQQLIVSNIELLLNYCQRYYGRQFATRTNANKDVVVSLEAYLTNYFDSGTAEREGLPTVQSCAREMGYSPNYLSDLLRSETGRNTRDHIHFHVIEKAKNMLLGSEETVARVAYSLGFEYPQHLSRLFKTKTGMTPVEYRSVEPASDAN